MPTTTKSRYPLLTEIITLLPRYLSHPWEELSLAAPLLLAWRLLQKGKARRRSKGAKTQLLQSLVIVPLTSSLGRKASVYILKETSSLGEETPKPEGAGPLKGLVTEHLMIFLRRVRGGQQPLRRASNKLAGRLRLKRGVKLISTNCVWNHCQSLLWDAQR